MLLQLLQRLAVMLNNWTEIIGGEEEEKWIRLLRFETEIGLNSAIEVQSEASPTDLCLFIETRSSECATSARENFIRFIYLFKIM